MDLSVDILINNAGFTIADKFTETDWPRQQNMSVAMMVTIAGLTHAFLPPMLERKWGRIINVASNLAWAPGGIGHTQYPASKAYVLRFSQSLFQETHGSGVHVTVTCPGSTQTDFQKANDIEATSKNMPSFLVQSVEQAVDSAIKANEKGKSVHVPGWHNKLLVSLLQLAPDQLVMPFVRRASK